MFDEQVGEARVCSVLCVFSVLCVCVCVSLVKKCSFYYKETKTLLICCCFSSLLIFEIMFSSNTSSFLSMCNVNRALLNSKLTRVSEGLIYDCIDCEGLKAILNVSFVIVFITTNITIDLFD